jgi:hypothetical protein
MIMSLLIELISKIAFQRFQMPVEPNRVKDEEEYWRIFRHILNAVQAKGR